MDMIFDMWRNYSITHPTKHYSYLNPYACSLQSWPCLQDFTLKTTSQYICFRIFIKLFQQSIDDGVCNRSGSMCQSRSQCSACVPPPPLSVAARHWERKYVTHELPVASGRSEATLMRRRSRDQGRAEPPSWLATSSN